MSDMTRWTRASQFVLMGVALLGGMGQSRQANTLGAQMAGMAGQNLTRAECQQRMQNLGQLLQQAGYRRMHARVAEDGTLIARWYHAGRKMTAMAFSGQNTVGNAFSAGEYAGLLRWNEFLGAP